MSFGKRLSEIRKKKAISQEDLAKMIGTKAPVISRYEREIAKPTIEVACRLAQKLGVSLDYLVGNSDTELDDKLIEKIIAIQNLKQEDKEHIFALMDAFLLKSNIQKHI